MNELALFAGSGGGILGGYLLGWKTVAACEIEDYPRETLLRRQLDGILPRFPIWDDIRTFDGSQFRDRIDIVTGGFPCQDISAAGKGAGIDGERSGLWKEMHRIIDEVRPRFAFMENSPMLASRGLRTVLGDLAEIGYDAEWDVLGADDVGAPHRRKRIWILAYTGEAGLQGNQQHRACDDERNRADAYGSATERRCLWWDTDPADVSDSGSYTARAAEELRPKEQNTIRENIGNNDCSSRRESEIETTKPVMGRVANGVAHRVDRLKAIGNGQVPAVAAIAFLTLYRRIFENGNE